MTFYLRVFFALTLLISARAVAQLEVGVQGGPMIPRFYVENPDADPFPGPDVTASSYLLIQEHRTAISDVFVRVKKRGLTATVMPFFMARHVQVTEYYQEVHYDPGTTSTNFSIHDTRTLDIKIQGIYAALLVGYELQLDNVGVYVNGGLFTGRIIGSSETGTGTAITESYNPYDYQTVNTVYDAKGGLTGAESGWMTSFGFHVPIRESILFQMEFQGSTGTTDLPRNLLRENPESKFNSANIGLNFGLVYRWQ